MFLWILVGIVAALVFWLVWGQGLWVKYKLFKQNERAIKAVEGAGQIYNDIMTTTGEIKNIADSLTHGDGNFFSRATGAFSSVVR
jgi:hypothetical protein